MSCNAIAEAKTATKCTNTLKKREKEGWCDRNGRSMAEAFGMSIKNDIFRWRWRQTKRERMNILYKIYCFGPFECMFHWERWKNNDGATCSTSDPAKMCARFACNTIITTTIHRRNKHNNGTLATTCWWWSALKRNTEYDSDMFESMRFVSFRILNA